MLFGFLPLIALAAACAVDRREEAEEAGRRCAPLKTDPFGPVPDDCRETILDQLEVDGDEDDPRREEVIRALALGAAADTERYERLLRAGPRFEMDREDSDRGCDEPEEEGAKEVLMCSRTGAMKKIVYSYHDYGVVWPKIVHELAHLEMDEESEHVECPPDHKDAGRRICDADDGASWGEQKRAAEAVLGLDPELDELLEEEIRWTAPMILSTDEGPG